MGEALDKNPFYRALVGKFEKLFQVASDKCYIVCVPTTSSCGNLQINERTIRSHILKPSPLLKQNYIPLDISVIKAVERDKNMLIVVRSDSNRKVNIPIIGVEEAYNAKNQSYEIAITAIPLTDLTAQEPNIIDSTISDLESDDVLILFKDCVAYLERSSPTITEMLRQKVHQMSKTYIVLPNYLSDAAQRFHVVIDWALAQYEAEGSFTANREVLSSAVERSVGKNNFTPTKIFCSLAMGLVYDKVFEALSKSFEAEENIFKSKLAEMKISCSTLETLGSSSSFNNFEVTQDMRSLLTMLPQLITPIEKLDVLKNVLSCISGELTRCSETIKNPFDDSKISILPDDLVAATIFVLMNTETPHLLCHIRYIQNFSSYLPTKNEYGYSLVTFEVAVEFVRNLNSLKLENSTSPGKRTSHSSNDRNRSYSFHDYQRQTSQYDSELEKITRLIETKVGIAPKDAQEVGVAANSSAPNDSDLGEFLSALQQNQFVVGSGKQYY